MIVSFFNFMINAKQNILNNYKKKIVYNKIMQK